MRNYCRSNKVEVEKTKKDGFYIYIETMTGDADDYHDTEVGPFKKEDLDLLDEIVTVLKTCIDDDCEGYEVPNYNKWFSECYDTRYPDKGDTVENLPRIENLKLDYWPEIYYSEYCQCDDKIQSFCVYEIVNGVSYEVSINE